MPALNDLDRLVDEARKRKARAEEQADGGPVQSPVPYEYSRGVIDHFY